MRSKAKKTNISKVINSIQIPNSNNYNNLNINLNIYNGQINASNQINIVKKAYQHKNQSNQEAYHFKTEAYGIQQEKQKNVKKFNQIGNLQIQKSSINVQKAQNQKLKVQLRDSEEQSVYTDNPLQLYHDFRKFQASKAAANSKKYGQQEKNSLKTVNYYLPKRRYQQIQQEEDQQYLQGNKRRFFSRDSGSKQKNPYKIQRILINNNKFIQAFKKDRSLELRRNKMASIYSTSQANKNHLLQKNFYSIQKQYNHKNHDKSPYLANNRYSLTHQGKRQQKIKVQPVRENYRKSITKQQIGKRINNLYTKSSNFNTLSNSSSKSFKFSNLRITQHLKSEHSNSKDLKTKNSHETIQDQMRESHQVYLQKKIQKSKEYFSLGLYKESLIILQQVLSSEPNNLESLYLSAMCFLNAKNYKRCLKLLNKVVDIDEKFNKMCYILGAICQNKLNINNSGRLKLLKCIKLFPDFQQAYIYLGKFDYETKRYNEGIQYLLKARKINPEKLQTLINLSSCYYALKKFHKCTQIYQQIIKLLSISNQRQQKQELNKQGQVKEANNKQLVARYYEKLIILLVQKTHQYQKAIKISNQYIEHCKNIKKQQKNIKKDIINPLVYYILAFSQFKQKKYSEASMTLQIIINSNTNEFILQSTRHLNLREKQVKKPERHQLETSQYLIESICLLVAIKIVHSDYYEACHILERINHLIHIQDHINNPQIKQMAFFKNFCEGVVCLMKRKIDDGVIFLQKIRPQINSNGSHINGFKKLKTEVNVSRQDNKSGQEIRTWIKLQVFNIIKRIYHMYVSFGYFCKSEFKKCKEQIKKQLDISLQQKYHDTLHYNLELSQGILFFKQKKYQQAVSKFNIANKRYPRKPEPYLYTFICKCKQFYNCQTSMQNKEVTMQYEHRQIKSVILEKNIFEQEMGNVITQCCNIAKQMNNNCGANVFYHRSVFKAHFRKWSEALQDIDQAIERSQENYWKYYYVRGLILACCHNFKQAINQLAVAITLNEKFAKLYLVRSKCLQIDGDCNQAFLDLQSYISLQPEDSSIHKYAGHLLFQNGAFQDAILAYSHGQIPQIQQNFDVFLTRSKTYFLIGKFQQAKMDMKIATQLKPGKKDIYFDYQIVEIINQIVLNSHLLSEELLNQDQQQHQIRQKVQKSKEKFIQIVNQLNKIYQKQGASNNFRYGKIFKPIEQSILNATIQFYLKNYDQAIKYFKQCIKTKQLSFLDQSNEFLGTNKNNISLINNVDQEKRQLNSEVNQSQFQQQQNQRRIYVNQMFFNLSICYLMKNDYENAQKMLDKCNISPQSKIYENYYKFKLLVRGQLDFKQLKTLNQLQVNERDEVSSSQQQNTQYQANLEDSISHLNKISRSASQFAKNRKNSQLFLKNQTENPIKKQQNLKPSSYIEVFSLNNKLSNFLPLFKVPSRIENQTFWMKLCLPFPKVEPPQIFPTFDQQIMKQFDVDNVQTKPQAPWIERQDNSIKFTDKIEVFSRLQLQKSEASNHIKKQTLMRDIDGEEGMYLDGNSFEQSSIQIGENLKERLKLDAGIQDKLNKLMKKSKNEK